MRPIIGITCNLVNNGTVHSLNVDYARAVEAAGGMPVILPAACTECAGQILHMLDGLILSGGGDLDPAFFDEEPVPGLGEITPERDLFELELTKQALKADLAILAICRGMQVLNVAMGGTLYQDINSQLDRVLKHRQEAPRWYASHKVSIKNGSLLSRILQSREVRVNSMHHQAVNKVGYGLKVTAQAADGVIEGVESENHKFVLGVQWHPEAMWAKDPLQLKLFTALVEAAKK
ncbi:MAG: gamma-glutamyl-gamma-aminobutyrate hydrolase family protein [Bacillota bacterium]